MKRSGSLWDRLISFDHLHESARRAMRSKRKRGDVAQFWMNLGSELVRLQDELVAGNYRPGGYRSFRIRDPKERLISAAPFRDRVVHHALAGVVEPIFERVFIPASFASRPGKGTHRAIARFQQLAGRFPYVFKCDVAKYFPSIDHAILKDLLARKIKDRRVLNLAGRISTARTFRKMPAFSSPATTCSRPWNVAAACRWAIKPVSSSPMSISTHSTTS